MSDERAVLVIDEERTYERADARWVRMHCNQGCIEIEARYAPADHADAFVEALHAAHDRLHKDTSWRNFIADLVGSDTPEETQP